MQPFCLNKPSSKILSRLEKKVAELEKMATDFWAKDLYYSTNKLVLAEDAKHKLLQLGHEVMDLCKDKETWNGQLTVQTQAVADLQAQVDQLNRELESPKKLLAK